MLFRSKLTYDDVNNVLGKADFFAVADIAAAVLAGDGGETLTSAEAVLSTGKGVGVLLRDLLSFFNNLAIIKMCRNAEDIVNLPKDKFTKLKSIADGADGHTLLRATEILARCEGDLRYSADGRITLETALMRAAMPATDSTPEALLARIEKLERQIAEGVKVTVKSRTEQPRAQVGQADNSYATELVKEKQAESVQPKPDVAPLEEVSPFDGQSPFGGIQNEQPTLFEQSEQTPPKNVCSLSERDKATLFGRFIKLFRTTKRNAVLFTLCMDLESTFEGDTFVLITSGEVVYKSLNREEHRQFIAEALQSLGVFSFDIRLKPKGEDKYEKAIGELRDNFKGTDIEIK